MKTLTKSRTMPGKRRRKSKGPRERLNLYFTPNTADRVRLRAETDGIDMSALAEQMLLRQLDGEQADFLMLPLIGAGFGSLSEVIKGAQRKPIPGFVAATLDLEEDDVIVWANGKIYLSNAIRREVGGAVHIFVRPTSAATTGEPTLYEAWLKSGIFIWLACMHGEIERGITLTDNLGNEVTKDDLKEWKPVAKKVGLFGM